MASNRQCKVMWRLAGILSAALLLISTPVVRSQDTVKTTSDSLTLRSNLPHSPVAHSQDLLAAVPESLQARILLTADRFIPLEPIVYESWVENLADTPILWKPLEVNAVPLRLESLDHPELNPRIGQKLVPISVSYAPGHEELSVELAPLDKAFQAYSDLLSGYGLGPGVTDLYLPLGRYRVYAPGINTDTAFFEVTYPTSRDDSLAVASFMAYCDDLELITSPNRIDSAYADIQLRCPNSCLRPFILARRLSLKVAGGRFSDPDRLHQLAFELITRYPADYYAINGLFDIDVSQLSRADRDRLAAALARMAAENRRAIIDQRIPMIEELRARASNSTDR